MAMAQGGGEEKWNSAQVISLQYEIAKSSVSATSALCKLQLLIQNINQNITQDFAGDGWEAAGWGGGYGGGNFGRGAPGGRYIANTRICWRSI